MQRRQAWQRRLNEGRWAAINWPREWGGREATIMQNVIYSEEMAKAKTPGIYNANGIWQIGPMIIRWGTDEQKQRWLPGILNADVHWCQGFSEPQAGQRPGQPPHRGDARRRRVHPQRAEDLDLDRPPRQVGPVPGADRPDAIGRGAKHEGITALIVDMDAPGIECRPIRDVTGECMFNEVFFTDAPVPVAYRLGEEGKGWRSPWAPSATSGSAPAGCRSGSRPSSTT